MRTIVIIGFAAGLLAAALPAQAANSTNHNEATPAPPQANGAPAPARQICVRDERSESRIRRQICHTAREWRNLEGEVPGEH